MEVDKVIFNYYKSEIDKIKKTPHIMPGEIYKKNHDKIYNFIFAAVLAVISVVLVSGVVTPSTLADKSSKFYAYYNLDTIIPAGLVEINKFASKSFKSGGDK